MNIVSQMQLQYSLLIFLFFHRALLARATDRCPYPNPIVEKSIPKTRRSQRGCSGPSSLNSTIPQTLSSIVLLHETVRFGSFIPSSPKTLPWPISRYWHREKLATQMGWTPIRARMFSWIHVTSMWAMMAFQSRCVSIRNSVCPKMQQSIIASILSYNISKNKSIVFV